MDYRDYLLYSLRPWKTFLGLALVVVVITLNAYGRAFTHKELLTIGGLAFLSWIYYMIFLVLKREK